MTDTHLYPREAEIDDAAMASIVDAILSAYPNKEFLALRLRSKWGVRVEDEISAMDVPGRILVDRIGAYARAQGSALDLLGLTWSDKPNNPKLAALADMWLTDKPGVLERYRAPAPDAAVQPPPPLQSLVARQSRLLNLGAFIAGLQRLSRAVCRIGIPEVSGTGFLIGRRTVLTNYHVVRSVIAPTADGASIVCEFDFTGPGAAVTAYHGAPGADWLGPNRPFSQSDLTGTGTPGSGELDFAVIHLDREVEPERAALLLPEVQPLIAQSDYLLIAQHPRGGDEQLAIGQVVSWPGDGLRCRYDVTTEPGSSGSPVLDFDLQLAALHHAAEPGSAPRYNQGVPIKHIRAALVAAGLDPAAL
jgi:hypothetical protein